MHSTVVLYHKQGKIHWAKHSWFHPYEVFHGNTFTVPWPAVYYSTIAKYSWKNFRGTLKNRENRKGLAKRIFPHLWYLPTQNAAHRYPCT